MKHLITCIAFLLPVLSIEAVPGAASDGFLFGGDSKQHIEVNNRVLAHVNGKGISVLDVMKKMDMSFLRQFPEYASIPQARFQYYQANWRNTLQELIDKELIMADAIENKIPLTAGDVRQEMETLFGPNIIANLDRIGLSFDEAYKIVHGDLLIRRMMGARVNSKAMRIVTPQVIRERYEEFAKQNVKKDTWHYQVVTIRNNDPTAGAETAQLAVKMLTEDKVAIGDLPKAIKEKSGQLKSTLTVSEDQYHTQDDMSDFVKGAVKDLKSGEISKPIAQKSRTDKSTLFRILFVKEIVPGGAIPYSQIENQIKDELYEVAIAAESDVYLKKLHKQFAIHENYLEDMIPANFQPFELK